MRKAPEGIAGAEWHVMLLEKARCRRPEILDDLHQIYLERANDLRRSGVSPKDALKTIRAEKPTGRENASPIAKMKP